MSTRKPAGVSWESWTERQIREAQERGDFDHLPGAGEPIPDLHRPHDELWWVRKKMEEEGLSYLPPALQLRKQVEEAREQIGRARSEAEVRRIVTDINRLIRTANRTGLNGPPSTAVPLDEERTVRAWHEQVPSTDP